MKVKIVALNEDANLCKVQIPTQKCDSCIGDCVLNVFSKPAGKEAKCGHRLKVGQIWVSNAVEQFVCGDSAELQISRRAIIMAALIIFVIPVLCLVLPVGIVSLFFETSERFLYTVSVLGLICGLVVAVLCGTQINWSNAFDVHLRSGNEP